MCYLVSQTCENVPRGAMEFDPPIRTVGVCCGLTHQNKSGLKPRLEFVNWLQERRLFSQKPKKKLKSWNMAHPPTRWIITLEPMKKDVGRFSRV